MLRRLILGIDIKAGAGEAIKGRLNVPPEGLLCTAQKFP